MRKTATRLSKVKVNGRQFFCVTWPKIGTGRNRRFFKDRREAETFLESKRIEQENYGTAGTSFNERQRAEYLECAESLKQFNATIRDAVNFYLPHLKATKRTCTAVELVDDLLKVKEADGARERYLSDLRSRLTQFSDSLDGKPVAEITSPQVDEWLRNLCNRETGKPLAATTRNNFRRVLIVAFNFGHERGYCAGNPAKKSAKAKEIESAVGILTVDQTARLLENATPEIVPYVAIGAFAGLRRAELERLDWSEVDLKQRLIEVVARKAKSARRRFVRIQPNLFKWLQPYVKSSGNVTPARYRGLLGAAREAAKIHDWPGNALRHSFASYHLAHFKDAAALALELGHTNSNLVFQHYRQLVRPKNGKSYWSVCPPSRGKIVPFVKAA
jgi:integrase